MGWRWFWIGTISFALCVGIIFPLIFGIPDSLYGSDDLFYSNAAINLLRDGRYSIDGFNPYNDREPGQSVLLAGTFWLFGIQTHIGIFIVHAILLFLGALTFSQTIARIASSRSAGITFLLILTSGSILHAVFTAYREILTLFLLCIFLALYLTPKEKSSSVTAVLLGVVLACTTLTFYSFFFLPIAIIPIWLLDKKSLKHLVIVLGTTALLLSGWAYRNYAGDGEFKIIDNRRGHVMWFVRGIQAKEVKGLEPLRCLWSEYISRNWEGRSRSCSFNAVMHTHWPNGFRKNPDTSPAGSEGKKMILENFVSYLWFSVVDTIELHIPYVGGGWSKSFNLFAAITQGIILLGCVLSVRSVIDKKYRMITLLIAYNTLFFILTDATPRYIIPVFFCYAGFAGIGYDWLMKRFSP